MVESQIAVTMEKTGKSRDVVCKDVLKHYQRMSGQWTCGRKPQIAYHDPICRTAYLYGIVPAFANLVEYVFRRDTELATHFLKVHRGKGKVSICAFGGGPGTELLGVAKWVEKNTKPGEQVSIEYLLLDKVNEWLESWRAIKNAIESRFRKNISRFRKDWPLVLSGDFSKIDITDTSGFGNLGSLFEQDIFVLSYVVSEVFSEVEELTEFSTEVANNAPIGSKFVFIDRAGDTWKNDVTRLAKNAGLRLSAFRETKTNMDTDEESSHLGSLIHDIGWNPKLTWNAFWVVGTKE
jgi:hypothetical protein